MKDFSKKIFVSITGSDNKDWQEKLKEIKKLKIEEVAVFVSMFDKKERDQLYKFLLKSNIKRIPLVHLRHDTNNEDIKFFTKNFGTKHFNIHENHFDFIENWEENRNKLYLELNYDNEVSKNIDINKIGGFCIDLAHFKSSISRGTKEAGLIFFNKDKKITCNHLSGYDKKDNIDIHYITDIKQFDYIETLPDFVFGDIIAIEINNSIKEQLEFKKYIVEILNNKNSN